MINPVADLFSRAVSGAVTAVVPDLLRTVLPPGPSSPPSPADVERLVAEAARRAVAEALADPAVQRVVEEAAPRPIAQSNIMVTQIVGALAAVLLAFGITLTSEHQAALVAVVPILGWFGQSVWTAIVRWRSAAQPLTLRAR